MSAPAPQPATRVHRPAAPVDVPRTLGVLRRGPADPSFRLAPDGAVWRVSRTPDGPGTLRVTARPADGEVRGEAWGPGAGWLLDALPDLVGAADAEGSTGFVPRHPVIAEAHRRHPGLRLCRTGLVVEALVPAVLEQKVTTVEAYRGWRLLLARFGEPAPGPVPDPRMRTPLPAAAWLKVPSWEWHRAGVDARRAGTVMRAVRVAAALERTAALTAEEAAAKLRTLPGIGIWTAAETLQRSHGAADLVSVGDLHLPRTVGRELAGVPDGDDALMVRLLAVYAGQRQRAVRLLLSGSRRPPRHIPRQPIRDFRRM
nr:DNA-3-methyladenine glycosylase 2 family protein [Mangrovactinospora gilvigrisea]